MINIDLTTEQAEALQGHVSEHMLRCYDYLEWTDLHYMDDVPEEYQKVEMFCGCDTCVTREYLMSTFDFLRDNNIVDIAVV